MIVECIRFVDDGAVVDFTEADGTGGKSVDVDKDDLFAWMRSSLKTIKVSEARGMEVDDFDIESLLQMSAQTKIADRIAAGEATAEILVADTVAQDGGILGHVASWFWEGTAKDFDDSGLSAVQETDKWQTFGPKFCHRQVWERLLPRLPSGRWYCMILREKYKACHDLLDMMNTKRGG